MASVPDPEPQPDHSPDTDLVQKENCQEQGALLASEPDPEPQPDHSPEGRERTITTGENAQVQGVVGEIHGGVTFIQSAPPSREELDHVCHCLEAMLKAKYRQVKIPKMPWLEVNWEFPLDHYYVDLTVTPKEDQRRNLHAKEVQIHEIFNRVANKISTRILIEGPGGYGKSMLALKLCYDWAKGEEYMSHYKLVILLRLKEFKDSTIDEMLAEKVKLQKYSTGLINESIQKHQTSTLIILDGYDESNQTTRSNLDTLLNSEYFPTATVIVTSRPGAIGTLDDFDKRIEIKGLKGFKRQQFLQLHLQSCNEEQKLFVKEYLRINFDVSFPENVSARIFHRLRQALGFVQKESLCDCPLFLLLVAVVVKHSYPNVAICSSKTELFKQLFNFVARRTTSERVHSEQTVDLFLFDKVNPPPCVTALSKFGKLALTALTVKQFTFTREEILSQCDNDDFILQTGLLTENDSIDDIAGQQASWVQPIHLSILEFSAAYHIWYTFTCQTDKFEFPNELLPHFSGAVDLFVFPFLIGLCGNELASFISLCFRTHLHFRKVRSVISLARCGSLLSESSLDLKLLSEALSPLVPDKWETFYFIWKGDPTDLLKETVAQALVDGRVREIWHDCDLAWDITMGKEKTAHVEQIVIQDQFKPNIRFLKATYQNVKCSVLSIPSKFSNSFKMQVAESVEHAEVKCTFFSKYCLKTVAS